jgi:methyltransferase (TIGR00027 family)
LTVPLTSISDTARWVAVYRAMESDRSDALFRDPYARRLAGERGEAIVRALPHARSSAWAMIVRTCLFDERILKAVRNDKADVVLNLAAGLDTRPYRLDLPRTLRWIDVDLPAVLAYKTETLAGARPSCAVESVPLDLSNAVARLALFSRVAKSGARVLVVTEGLLVYLTEKQVGELAADLHAQTSFRWWLIDIASPELLALLRRYWGRALDSAQSPLQFAPPQGPAFFEAFGWREKEFLSTFEESRRLRRQMRLAWAWRFAARFFSPERRERMRRMGGTVLLERA